MCLEAGDGTRTRDPQLGRLMLYQLSYTRVVFSGEAGKRVSLLRVPPLLPANVLLPRFPAYQHSR